VRAVVDTNVLLSGLIWHGAPHALLEQIRAGVVTLVSSPALIAELAEVIDREKFRTVLARSNTVPARMLAEVRLLAEILVPPPLLHAVSRDPDDDAVLALAAAAQPDLIITGDRDLLALGTYVGLPIVTPAQALARLGGAP
jgi:putative PIN family toxin of toxin-antitoxin system